MLIDVMYGLPGPAAWCGSASPAITPRSWSSARSVRRAAAQARWGGGKGHVRRLIRRGHGVVVLRAEGVEADGPLGVGRALIQRSHWQHNLLLHRGGAAVAEVVDRLERRAGVRRPGQVRGRPDVVVVVREDHLIDRRGARRVLKDGRVVGLAGLGVEVGARGQRVQQLDPGVEVVLPRRLAADDAARRVVAVLDVGLVDDELGQLGAVDDAALVVSQLNGVMTSSESM